MASICPKALLGKNAKNASPVKKKNPGWKCPVLVVWLVTGSSFLASFYLSATAISPKHGGSFCGCLGT